MKRKLRRVDVPPRIVVEVISSSDVTRLREEDEKTRAEIKALEKRLEGLHRSFYELLEAFGNLRSKQK